MKEFSQFTEIEGPADFFTVFAGNNRYTNPVVLHQLIRIGDFDFFNIERFSNWVLNGSSWL